MLKAARKAAKGLMRDFSEVEQLQVSRKGTRDFVSTADHRAEQTLREELQAARPDYGLLMEETGEIKGNDKSHRWIVDPLDGTVNFLHGLPHFCIALALEKEVYAGKREIVAAVVEAPALRETFWAERGAGAWLERADSQERIRVAARRNLEDSLVMTGYAQRGNNREMIAKVAEHTCGIRTIGSSALELAYIAAGRGDIFIQQQEKQWDIASGILLIKEAGGYVTDFNGGEKMLESGNIIASNDILHKAVHKLIAE